MGPLDLLWHFIVNRFSVLKWIISSWIFDYADGFLKQQQFDVKFTSDIRILNYTVKEGSAVKKGIPCSAMNFMIPIFVKQHSGFPEKSRSQYVF